MNHEQERRHALRVVLRMYKQMRKEHGIRGIADYVRKTCPSDDPPVVPPQFWTAVAAWYAQLDQLIATLSDMVAGRLPLDTPWPDLPKLPA
jgi:hypothetical protein